MELQARCAGPARRRRSQGCRSLARMAASRTAGVLPTAERRAVHSTVQQHCMHAKRSWRYAAAPATWRPSWPCACGTAGALAGGPAGAGTGISQGGLCAHPGKRGPRHDLLADVSGYGVALSCRGGRRARGAASLHGATCAPPVCCLQGFSLHAPSQAYSCLRPLPPTQLSDLQPEHRAAWGHGHWRAHELPHRPAQAHRPRVIATSEQGCSPAAHWSHLALLRCTVATASKWTGCQAWGPQRRHSACATTAGQPGSLCSRAPAGRGTAALAPNLLLLLHLLSAHAAACGHVGAAGTAAALRCSDRWQCCRD